MVNQFKSNRPYNNFLLLIYGVVILWALFAKSINIENKTSADFLFTVFKNMKIIAEHNKFPASFYVFILLFVQALVINQIAIKQKLFPKINYLTGMCFLLFSSLFINKIEMSSALTVSPMLLWVLSKICGLQNVSDSKKNLFNIGLVIGIATLIFQPAIIFLFVILFALLITRPFRLTEWVVLIIGGLTPYYFIASWLFLSGRPIMHFIPSLQINIPTFTFNVWETSAGILILLTLLNSIYNIHVNMRKLLVQSRDSWTIIFFYFFIACFVPFFSPSADHSTWIFILSPAAIIAAATFLYINQKWLVVFLHWVLVVLSFVIAYFYMLK